MEVVTPISISRAQYWLGEALKAQGRAEEANAAYDIAARYPYVFYGQLAAEKVKDRNPAAVIMNFASLPQPTDEERAAFAVRRPFAPPSCSPKRAALAVSSVSPLRSTTS